MKLNLQELDKYIGGKCGGKEFYFGCWSPEEQEFEFSAIPDHLQLEQGKNWIAIRNGAGTADGLIFPKINIDDPEVVIFRGYLCEASIHSYSASDQVKDYWSQDLIKRHNGIFSAVRISNNGEELNIVTDIFGLSPIYIRKIGKIIFFSSTPALLSLKDDQPDMMSWFMRLTEGFIPHRNSLSKEIELAAEASVTTFGAQGKTIQKWYDYEDFPKGEEPVSDLSLELSEQKLKVAMKRCQNVHFGEVMLPLSSGYDSRRLFAHLEKSEIAFSACTVQSLMEGGVDIEAECAIKITQDYNIKHHVFTYPSPEEWHKNDIQRIFSMDGQCQVHTWSVPFFNYYENHKCCFYDGTGGDIFGFNGWVFTGHIEKMIPHAMPSVLKQEVFPDYGTIEKKLREWKAEQPAGSNQSMLTFTLWQTRKSSACWAQQQSRPGHLILYPYFDLDYIETMLRFALEDNVVNRPQKAILYKYWPKLASYRGSRELPENVTNSIRLREENNRFSLKKIIAKSLSLKDKKLDFQFIHTFMSRCILLLSRFVFIEVLPAWWLRSSAELIFWWNSRPNIIEPDKNNSE